MSTSQPNAIAPTITSVKGANGVEIANGAKTTETSVILAGNAQPAQQVEVFDGTFAKGTVVVDPTGKWTFSLTGLSVGLHSITAKALYGAGDVSQPRTFNVVSNK
ncbi:hypothetical protein PS925_06009 [Pseudomonas fluorescens]|uniref:Uncharacterized protein n=1 Tax=Pseudomonas fluorescens TaxID=294 RepID=A0A5E7VTJ4_PSEFL|nr:hypothetical protein [Pseudomonas fluorescens]VVQ25940.1 hypothetical protein PS925_06009 [Pseudomonas fluorescens]